MHQPRQSFRMIPAMLLLAAGGAVPAAGQAMEEWLTHCMPRDPDNGDFRLVGGRHPQMVEKRTDLPTPFRVGSARFVEGLGWIDELDAARAPNPANRLDIVFVGDGYTGAQLGTYADQVTAFADAMFRDEPFATYRPLFGIHRVDVVSIDSGVDNDPTQGISRNTAMNMRYWCSNIERLLCIDVGLAYSYANTADLPDGNGPDQVIALANSSKYGGAGYPSSDLGTAAAGNSFAVEIVVHELGHSLGNLGDEYDYGGPAAYPNPESSDDNISTRNAAQMAAQMTKWFRWLGVNNPAFDGNHSTFEGAQYSQTGVFRPTNNSKMRSLDRPFNLVSAEGLIKEIYRVVDPVDSFSPTDPFITAHTTLSVTPVQPIGHDLDIEWLENGVPIPGATGTSIDTCALGLTGFRLVTARVADNTDMVRDEAFRDQFMTRSVQFVLNIPANPADVNGDGTVGPDDFGAWVAAYNAGAPEADQNSDGQVTPADFSAWVSNYNSAGSCD